MSESVGDRVRLILFVLFGTLAVTGGVFWFAGRPRGRPVELAPPPATATPAPVRVHVSGEVARPGVYSLLPGSIVQDALEAAGGPTGDGDTGRLNLAAPLADGQQVYVPAIGETPSAANGHTSPDAPSGAPLNINAASAAELQTLPGIGPVTAAAIVEYRRQHGPFASVEELMDVPGIGPKTFEAIAPLIVAG